jgi:hypothetical protein
MRRIFALVVLLGGCSDSLYPAGHTCFSSEECAAGLLCDYGPTPHVCAGMSTAASDLSATPTPKDAAADAAMDAGSTDLAKPPTHDLAMPHDLSTPPDLSQID